MARCEKCKGAGVYRRGGERDVRTCEDCQGTGVPEAQQPEPVGEPLDDRQEQEDEATEFLDTEGEVRPLEAMKMNDLRKLAAELGLEVERTAKKADLVAAIREAE